MTVLQHIASTDGAVVLAILLGIFMLIYLALIIWKYKPGERPEDRIRVRIAGRYSDCRYMLLSDEYMVDGGVTEAKLYGRNFESIRVEITKGVTDSENLFCYTTAKDLKA